MLINKMVFWSMLVACVLSLSQVGCSDDNTGNQGENTFTEDAAVDAEPDAVLDASNSTDADSSDSTDAADLDVSSSTDAADSTDSADSTDAAPPDDANDGSDADTSADTGCKPGDTKEVECNTCICANNGTWGCTEIECEYEPCAGKTCGDRCTICAPDDLNCNETSVIKTCGKDGICSAGSSGC
jgi:hypothetical protein